MNAKHTCTQEPDDTRFRGFYGPAICDITYTDGETCWGTDNGEYRSPITFCPWCGIKLPLPPSNESGTITVTPA
jgi:hypothetical protein